KVDAGLIGVLSGAPPTRSGRPATTAMVSGCRASGCGASSCMARPSAGCAAGRVAVDGPRVRQALLDRPGDVVVGFPATVADGQQDRRDEDRDSDDDRDEV